MSQVLRKLEEVFGGGGQVAPGGTAAILTRTSTLDRELADKVISLTSLDLVYRGLGTIAATALADELDRNGLRAVDFATQACADALRERLVDNLPDSEQFCSAFIEQLRMRG
jgi:hypothetical protein